MNFSVIPTKPKRTPAEKALKRALKILRRDPLLLTCIVEDSLLWAKKNDHGAVYIAELEVIAKLVDRSAQG